MMQPKVVMRTEYANTYKQIPISAFFSSITDKGFEITAYVEEEDHTPPEPPQPNTVYVRRIIETRLVISAIQMKQFHELLGKQIAGYEQVYGKILSTQQVAEKFSEFAKQNNPDTMNMSSSKPSVGIQ